MESARTSSVLCTKLCTKIINTLLQTFMYSASRVFFDLPRLVGKRKKTLLTASSIHIEHAPKSNVTKPCSASLSSCDNN